MTDRATPGFMLCGTTIAVDGVSPSPFAEIIDVNGIGASRKTADASTGNSPNGWGEILVSCITRQKPFRVTVAFSGNVDWGEIIQRGKKTYTITWPAEDGYDTGGTYVTKAVVTDVGINGQLEERMTKVLEITPHGTPTITAGTPTAP